MISSTDLTNIVRKYDFLLEYYTNLAKKENKTLIYWVNETIEKGKLLKSMLENNFSICSFMLRLSGNEHLIYYEVVKKLIELEWFVNTYLMEKKNWQGDLLKDLINASGESLYYDPTDIGYNNPLNILRSKQNIRKKAKIFIIIFQIIALILSIMNLSWESNQIFGFTMIIVVGGIITYPWRE